MTLKTSGEISPKSELQPVANEGAHSTPQAEGLFQFEDKTKATASNRILQAKMNSSPRLRQLKAMQALADGNPDVQKVSQMKLAKNQGLGQNDQPARERFPAHPVSESPAHGSGENGVVQRIIHVLGRNDLAGQNSIRLWMLGYARQYLDGLGKMEDYAQPIRDLLADPDKIVRVDDDATGALQLQEYLLDYVYSAARDGDDPDMAARRELVDTIYAGNYPVRIVDAMADAMADARLLVVGLGALMNEAIGQTIMRIMEARPAMVRGDDTIEGVWERRKIVHLQNLASDFYDIIIPTLRDHPTERQALAQQWIDSDDELLADLGATIRSEPRAAPAVADTTGLDPNQYANGSAGDPIPITFYKGIDHYPDNIEPKAASDEPQFTWNVAQELILLNDQRVQLGGPGIFNSIRPGTVMQDNAGHQNKRPLERLVRKTLALNYDLRGVDIDHILDLGFKGKDEANNLWPLNSDVNRRPMTGGWRSRYLLHFKHAGAVYKGAIGSDKLYHKYFRIKDVLEGPGADGVPADSGTAEAGKKE